MLLARRARHRQVAPGRRARGALSRGAARGPRLVLLAAARGQRAAPRRSRGSSAPRASRAATRRRRGSPSSRRCSRRRARRRRTSRSSPSCSGVPRAAAGPRSTSRRSAGAGERWRRCCGAWRRSRRDGRPGGGGGRALGGPDHARAARPARRARPGLPVLLVVTHRPEFAPPWTGEATSRELRSAGFGRRENAALLRRGRRRQGAARRSAGGGDPGAHGRGAAVRGGADEGGARGRRAARGGGPLGARRPARAVAVPATPASLAAGAPRPAWRRRGRWRRPAPRSAASSPTNCSRRSRMPEDRLRDALGAARRGGAAAAARRPPEAVYSFKHALVQDAAYGTLLRGRAAGDPRPYRARSGASYSRRWPRRGRSCWRITLRRRVRAERAIHYWRRAGRLAFERSAMAEAVAHFTAGLQALAGPARRGRARPLRARPAGAIWAGR